MKSCKRKRVHAAATSVPLESTSSGHQNLYDEHEAMQQVARDLFNLTITHFDMDNDFDGDNEDVSDNNMISVQNSTGVTHDTSTSREMEFGDTEMDGADNDDEDDDEDGPVIVAMQDVQESYERNAALFRPTLTLHNDSDGRDRVRYPFLFAAVSNDEDIVMACARILDEQRDVTLVREAAAYLEDVEANK